MILFTCHFTSVKSLVQQQMPTSSTLSQDYLLLAKMSLTTDKIYILQPSFLILVLSSIFFCSQQDTENILCL